VDYSVKQTDKKTINKHDIEAGVKLKASQNWRDFSICKFLYEN